MSPVGATARASGRSSPRSAAGNRERIASTSMATDGADAVGDAVTPEGVTDGTSVLSLVADDDGVGGRSTVAGAGVSGTPSPPIAYTDPVSVANSRSPRAAAM